MYRIFSYGLDESLDLWWDISVNKWIQRPLTRYRKWKRVGERFVSLRCTYDALTPGSAMLKCFCNNPWPLEKPFREGLNFLKMSEEIQINE